MVKPPEITQLTPGEEAEPQKKEEDEEVEATSNVVAPSAGSSSKVSNTQLAQMFAQLARMSASYERLKARVDSLMELNKSSTERFSIISEQIGELRTMSMDRERQIDTLDIKATKAADLVEQAHPEKIMEENMRLDAKIESLKVKIDSNRMIYDSLMDEVKSIKDQIAVFKNTEEILHLNEDVKNQLMSIQKIKGVVELHASKVEGMFIEVQRNFTDFEKYAAIANDVKNTLMDMLKELNNIKAKVPNFASKEDVSKIKTELGSKLIEIDKIEIKIKAFESYVDDFKEKIKDLTDLRQEQELIDRDIITLKENMNIQKKEIKTAETYMNELLVEIEMLRDIIRRKLVNNYEPAKISKKVEEKKIDLTPLVDFINQNLKSGYNAEQIRQALVSKGWDSEKLDKAFSQVGVGG